MLSHATVGLLLFGAYGILGAWAGSRFDGSAFPYPKPLKWVNHGGDLSNDRWAKLEKEISPSTVGNLKEKWSFTTAGHVSATPTIADGQVYFPDWAGFLYAVKRDTGALHWKKSFSAIAGAALRTLNATLLSVTAPTIVGDRLIVGLRGPAVLLAVKRSTGDLLWTSVLDTYPLAIVTMSGTAYSGYFYVEETSNVVCCTFQAAFFKLDVKDGKKIWRVPMMPDNGGRQISMREILCG